MNTTEFKIYPFRKSKHVFDKTTWWKVITFENPKELRAYTRTTECAVCKGVYIETSDHVGLTHSHSFRQKVDDFGQTQTPKLKGFTSVQVEVSQVSRSIINRHMT